MKKIYKRTSVMSSEPMRLLGVFVRRTVGFSGVVLTAN